VDAIQATLGAALRLGNKTIRRLRAGEPAHAGVRASCTLEEERGR
jgi:hypothetical protein